MADSNWWIYDYLNADCTSGSSIMDPLTAMGGSATLGFAFKMVSNFIENRTKEKIRNAELLAKAVAVTDDSKDRANDRGGVWMKRFTVFIMISLFAYLVSGAGEPTNIVETIKGQEFLWGLWTTQPETIITQVHGAILDDTTRISVLSIISFLFGVDSATNK